MQEKEARAWIQANGKPCPCCGGLIVIQVERGLDTYIVEPDSSKGTAKLVTAEDAEAQMRTRGLRRLRADGTEAEL